MSGIVFCNLKGKAKMNKPIEKNELHANAEMIREKISLLVPGSRTFRDTADEISQMFKSLKLRREDRENLWTQFDSLYKEHKTKQQEFRDEQKRNTEQLEREIECIQESSDIFSKYSYAEQWKKIREVSQMFKTVKLSHGDRERLWTKFNEKCTAIKNKESEERSNKEFYSARDYRNEILNDLFLAKSAPTYSSVQMSNFGEKLLLGAVTMGALIPCAGEDKFDDVFRLSMKKLDDVIKKSSKTLTENKHKMTYEHKQECFKAITEAREFLNEQWKKFKEEKSEEYSKRQVFREEKQNRHTEWKNRILSNLEINREKHEKAVNDLSRMEHHLSDLQEKLSNARQGSYYDRVSGWISESEEQIESKKEWIAKLEQWIEEGEEKLRGS